MKVTVNNNSNRTTNIAEIFHTDTNWYGFLIFYNILIINRNYNYNVLFKQIKQCE